MDPATGLCTVSYQSDSRPNSSDEDRKRFVDERSARIDHVLEKLAVIADTDKSGSVSDKEAGDFRRLYEFAPRLRAAIDANMGSDEMIAQACGLSVSALRESISAYNQVVVRAEEVGLEGLLKIEWLGKD